MIILIQAAETQLVFDWDNFFKVAAVVSPVLSGLIVGYVTHLLNVRTKKVELIYQKKLFAIEQVSNAFINLKKYLWAVVAEDQGNEFAEGTEGMNSAYEHRIIIDNVYESNSMFISDANKAKVESFLGRMSFLCNAEIDKASGQNPDISYTRMYEECAKEVDEIIKSLNNDITP